MPRKKGKSISFDAMVKFFMHAYDIPTKRDVDKLLARLDRIGALIAAGAEGAAGGRRKRARRGSDRVPAADAGLAPLADAERIGLRGEDL